MVKILSWNTLETGEGGAWSNGWGCPLEIRRREELAKVLQPEAVDIDSARSKAEHMLTADRYRRVRATLVREILNGERGDDPIDFLLFQECTVGDFWDEPSEDNTRDSLDQGFFDLIESLYERVPCPSGKDGSHPETVQHVYVRRGSGWELSSSVRLHSDALVGGCLAEFVGCGNNSVGGCGEPSLVLVNLHGSSGIMRNPDRRHEGVLDLWKEIGSRLDKGGSGGDPQSSWRSRIVLCGDWNTQLSDLIAPFRDANSGLWPFVGLLDNATAVTDYPMFSTNHEDGFLAQYDGCLWFGAPPSPTSSSTSYLELEDVSWNLTGFMPKGTDGRLPGDNPGAAVYNNFSYHHSDNNEEGVYLNGVFLPGSNPAMALSDHLRIYTTLRIQTNRQPNRDEGKEGNAGPGHPTFSPTDVFPTPPIIESTSHCPPEISKRKCEQEYTIQQQSQQHQRRPYRQNNINDSPDNRKEDKKPQSGPKGLRG